MVAYSIDNGMWDTLLTASCLVLIIEGILPFLAPKAWREGLQSISNLNDNTIRMIGLAVMLAGTFMLYIVH